LGQVDSTHGSLLEFSQWWINASGERVMSEHVESNNGKGKESKESKVVVPEDFPRDPFPASLSGTQMKFAARKIDGRYVVGLTDDERQGRFLMCSDLVDQLTAYAERKHRERKDLSMPALLDEIDRSMRRKGWELGASEFDWISGRLRAKFL
jgi:hypothetical protein